MSSGMVILRGVLRGVLPRLVRAAGCRWNLTAPVALLALAALAFGWKAGDGGLWGAGERASAQATWQVLTHGAASTSSHPPLHAWAMAASCRLVGGHTPFALRLPSALAAVVLALFLAWFGHSAFDVRTGLLAGIVFVLSFGAVSAARSATIDALLAATTAIASILLFKSRDRSWSSLSWVAPGIAMGLGTLAAGAGALLLPVAAVLLHKVVSGRRPGASVALSAAALGVAISVAVLVAATQRTDLLVPALLALLRLPTGPDTTGAVEGLLLGLAPWTLFLPSAVLRVRKEVASSFVLCALGVTLLYSAWVRLPGASLGILLLPWAALLVGRLWSVSLEEAAPTALRWTIGLPFALSVVALPLAAWLARGRVQASLGAPEPLAMQGCLFLLLVSIWVSTFVLVRRTALRFAGLTTVALASLSFATLWGVPELDAARRERERRALAHADQRIHVDPGTRGAPTTTADSRPVVLVGHGHPGE